MAVQTSYEVNTGVAYEGLPYDLTNHNALGRSAEGSSIRFGAAVEHGTGDNQAVLPDAANLLTNGATSGNFLGIVMREHVRGQKSIEDSANLAPPLGLDKNYAEVTESVSVKTAGRIWIKTELAAVQGDPVYYRHTVLTTELLGAISNATSAENNLIVGAKFITSAGAGELAVIELATGV